MRKVLLLALPVAVVAGFAMLWPTITTAQSHTLAWENVRWDRRPLQGTHGLTSGFTPDPFPYRLTAGGGRNPVQIAAHNVPGCPSGCITRRPDFRFNFAAGSFPLLRFYVVTQTGADALLLINQPDGTWRCNDDHGQSGWGNSLMPAITYNNPPAGQYDIWIGTYDCSSHQPATLYVTELNNNHP